MKYQSGIIEKGGTINSLTVWPDDIYHCLKQKGQAPGDCLWKEEIASIIKGLVFLFFLKVRTKMSRSKIKHDAIFTS